MRLPLSMCGLKIRNTTDCTGTQRNVRDACFRTAIKAAEGAR